MLKDYRELGQDLKNYFLEIDEWPEITFTSEDVLMIKKIKDVLNVNQHSITLKIDENHCIVPSQYILYAIFIKEFALQLKDHLDLFIDFKKGKSNSDVCNLIKNQKFNIDDFNLDPWSDKLALKPFTDNSFAFGAKSIINGNEGNYSLRGTSDFYGSVILKIINVPDSSSTILGKIIYSLCDVIEVYDYLENQFIHHLPFLIKERNTNKFVFKLFNYLYEYDELRSIEHLISKNSDEKFFSIKTDELSLTSIFIISKTLLSDEELSSGGKIRFFNNPLFINNDNEFVYLSTEWTDATNSRLDLVNLKKILSVFYPELSIVYEENLYILKPTDSISTKNVNNQNIIFYGAPGTGKSHKIEKILKNYSDDQKERITFHPEYDYSCFVGGYRPSSELNTENGKLEITYKFVPQVFTNIYVEAWKNPSKDYFLAIEEINRGNCAEIFGDLFQLLDRKSNYTISPSKELKEHLEPLLVGTKGIEGGKMKLPSNLNILASMNTSDQSLFPMDSAFKRRWSWEYIPINDKEFNDDATETSEATKNNSYDYIVKIDDNLSFKWIDFIISVNKKITFNRNLGSDKCIGNYFIKPDNREISLDEFINKAIFYLWIDVFKDEDESIFSLIEKNISYENFFPIKSNGKDNLIKLLSSEILNVKITDKSKKAENAEEPIE